MTDLLALRQVVALLADDAHAATFQSLTQYRAAVLESVVGLMRATQQAADKAREVAP